MVFNVFFKYVFIIIIIIIMITYPFSDVKQHDDILSAIKAQTNIEILLILFAAHGKHIYSMYGFKLALISMQSLGCYVCILIKEL